MDICINSRTDSGFGDGVMMSTQYYGIEDLGMTAAQRQTLITALKDLGDNQSKYPNHRNHWRVRPDNQAVIFEGKFNDADWTVESIKNKLANIFNVDPATVGDSQQSTQYGPVVTYSRAGDKLRLIAFGGLLASWKDSHDQVLTYLANNHDEWEENE
jgi:hypothetical protein